MPLLEALCFAATVVSDRLGVASATKMCRSVMIKGLEAMVIESFTAARAYGVEDSVLARLRDARAVESYVALDESSVEGASIVVRTRMDARTVLRRARSKQSIRRIR